MCVCARIFSFFFFENVWEFVQKSVTLQLYDDHIMPTSV